MLSTTMKGTTVHKHHAQSRIGRLFGLSLLQYELTYSGTRQALGPS